MIVLCNNEFILDVCISQGFVAIAKVLQYCHGAILSNTA
jgi:hypothetical protein